MVRDWRRLAVWLIGAVAFAASYGGALAASPLNVPDNVGYDLLLAISGFAATMVGGAAATLVYDRAKNRHWRR